MFKVGDNVRIINNMHIDNKIHEISDIDERYCLPYWLKDHNLLFTEDELELCDDIIIKFNVGDKVKVKKIVGFMPPEKHISIGDIGLIDEIDDELYNPFVVKFGETIAVFTEDELELVEDSEINITEPIQVNPPHGIDNHSTFAKATEKIVKDIIKKMEESFGKLQFESDLMCVTTTPLPEVPTDKELYDGIGEAFEKMEQELHCPEKAKGKLKEAFRKFDRFTIHVDSLLRLNELGIDFNENTTLEVPNIEGLEEAINLVNKACSIELKSRNERKLEEFCAKQFRKLRDAEDSAERTKEIMRETAEFYKK